MAISEAQKRATAKYHKNNYDRIEIKIKKGNKNVIEEIAKKENRSMSQFILEAVNEKINSMGYAISLFTNKEVEEADTQAENLGDSLQLEITPQL